ncbi:MAG: penicillin-binding transpeptidase domain-containing protein [Actinomycetota bacterium]|nr:penicillin-binding transpeptidase domain-containing protein [Actinomycetota bacterium]
MNRPIRKVALALGFLLAAIFVNVNYIQVVKTNAYNDTSKYPDNRLPILAEYSSPRGQIDVQGTAIARSVSTKDELKYLRVYAQGPIYAPVTGYNSIVYGTDGIESAKDSVLSGSDPRQFGSQLADLFTGRNRRGGNVELTLNKAAQDAAYNAMKSPNGTLRPGAVVALDPTTGAILAAVSTPSYDPNKLSSHDSASIASYYASLLNDPATPMLDRALRQSYPPGSVFKVIVSAAALKANVKPTDQIPAPDGYWPYHDRTGPCTSVAASSCVQNFGGETCQNGVTATLAFAFAKSCNTAFAALAVDKLGGKQIADEASLFGFDGNQLSVPLTVARSTVGTSADLTDPGTLAHSSFGQQDVRMTPLQGAMIAAAVANGGILMTPYLVRQDLSSNFSVLSQTSPTQLATVLPSDLNQQLEQMMVGVVTSPEGTGGPANITDIPNVVVGGKTGTADTGIFKGGVQTPPHAWFSGFATLNGSAKIAVAVIIENGGINGSETTGGLAAAPVAKAVMEAYLRSSGAH